MTPPQEDTAVLDRNQERRTLELAYFCLSRLRKALRHLNNLEIGNGTISELALFESSSEMEDLVIALHHAYTSCDLLKGLWSEWATQDLRAAAKRFTSAWRSARGPDLRHAYSHYEEALIKPEHPRRDDDVAESIVWHKIEYRRSHAEDGYEPTPRRVTLLGTDYDVGAAYEAAQDLEEALRAVIAPIASRVAASEQDSDRRLPLGILGSENSGNFGIVQDHSHLGGGIDWDRKNAIDAARGETKQEDSDESD